MHCPLCRQPMWNVRREITNNFRTGKEFREYDKMVYQCAADDIWLSTEMPAAAEPADGPQRQAMQPQPAVTFVTGNANKLRELQALAPDGMEFAARSIDLPEIQSLDVREVVEDKVRRAYAAANCPVVVEDVSAGLDGLGGLPGPFIKFFEKTLGKRALLVIAPGPEPRVTIRCVAAYYDGARMLFGEGIIRGRAVEPRGEHGFGFDFTVVPDGETRTMAEMTMAEKNAISHRGQAFRALLRQLERPEN